MRRVGAWWAVLLAIGWWCVASAADRLAGQGLLINAPALDGGRALTARAGLALASGRAREALLAGNAAVARRPTDPVALRVAGSAALVAGHPAMGDQLLRLAGAAGWRDGPTQRYWATVSARAGAWDVAAERLDATLRADPGDRAAAAILRDVEREPAGRAALVARLAVPNGWAANWLAAVGGLDADAMRARLATLEQVWPHLAPDARARVGWALVDAGAAAHAKRLARPDGGVPDLSAASEGAGPFGWRLLPAAGLDATVGRHAAAPGLHVLATGMAPIPLASTVVLPPPSVARLSVAVAGARTDLPLLATLTCRTKMIEGEPLPAAPGRLTVRFAVPAGCGAARLTLAVAGGEAARGADFWLGGVSLTAVP